MIISIPIRDEDDNAAVSLLAMAMISKLKASRAKGRSGWDTPECTPQHLSNLLREHVDKGDPVDVANFCAFLVARGDSIAPRQCLHQIDEQAHNCIRPQCDPVACSDCACAITPEDESAQVVLGLLNALAVDDLGHTFQDGDSQAVDRARKWLQNRSSALQAAPPAPAAVAVMPESVLVPLARLKNARALIDRGFWNESSKILDELISTAPAQEHATQLAGQGLQQGVWLKPARAGRVYVAGPMTGLPEFNFPAFNAKAAELRASGWHVENPAEHGHVEGAEWADYLHYDIGRMATCSAIHLLPGWSRSRGAALEVHIASALGLEFQYAEGAERAAPAQAQEDALDADRWRALEGQVDEGRASLIVHNTEAEQWDGRTISEAGDLQDYADAIDAARTAQGGAA